MSVRVGEGKSKGEGDFGLLNDLQIVNDKLLVAISLVVVDLYVSYR